MEPEKLRDKLRSELDAMTPAEVIDWLRARGVLVLRPDRMLKSALVNTALDVAEEIEAGRLTPPRPTASPVAKSGEKKTRPV